MCFTHYRPQTKLREGKVLIPVSVILFTEETSASGPGAVCLGVRGLSDSRSGWCLLLGQGVYTRWTHPPGQTCPPPPRVTPSSRQIPL